MEDRNQRAVVRVFILTRPTSKANRRLIKQATNFPVFSAHRVWRIYCPQTPRLITFLTILRYIMIVLFSRLIQRLGMEINNERVLLGRQERDSQIQPCSH